ncbi:type 2 lanthipeptide synthetase LanM family protein [Amycolatopsis sp. NPDC049868]|uniref:type 2 lanthipeptide synthetase LanM family protein n=1 Tax=Amycolatopsis sp. NPDC049868 TaxID=3363934 RepID=UPI0037A60DA7
MQPSNEPVMPSSVVRDLAASTPWVTAATLAERIAASPQPVACESDHGDYRVASWSELWWVQGHPEAVHDRLAAIGLDWSDFRALLTESPDGLAARMGQPPQWWVTFVESVETADDHTGDDEIVLGLSEFMRPVVLAARRRVAASVEIALRGNVPLQLVGLREVMLATLPTQRLLDAVTGALVLELNVARLEGRLDGDSPEARFADFLSMLAKPDVAAALWHEYPVMVRHVVELCDQWARRAVEFAERLIVDLPELIDSGVLAAGAGQIVEVSFGAGDLHRDGQAVAIVKFEDSNLVYKPRSLRSDVAFSCLLNWFNATGPRHRLRAVRVLDRPEYGWAEFVGRADCEGISELPSFYWRMGSLLALLHTLQATDFHLENVVAAGDNPVVVDLEALFHTFRTEIPQNAPGSASDPAYAFLEHSVIQVGLLPTAILYQDERQVTQSVDVSGVGGNDRQLTPIEVPVWAGVATDSMRLINRRLPMPGGDNQPIIDGERADPSKYRADLARGFTATYRTVVEHRAELLAPGGPLDQFNAARLRLILRPTRFYARLLQDSLHPDFLRDALDRDICLDRLWGGLVGHPYRDRLIQSEIAQLATGNIPIFEFFPASRDLLLADGLVLQGFFSAAPSEVVRERIEQFGEDDLDAQSRVIESSFACHEMGVSQEPWSPYATTLSDAEAVRDDLVDAATQIGERLLATAFRADRRIGWLGLDLVDERIWTLNAAGTDLYSGLPGIGVFLGYLGRIANHAEAAAAAETIADHLCERFAPLLQDGARLDEDDPDHRLVTVGGFGPLAGPLYFLSTISALTGDDRWTETARGLGNQLIPRCGTDPHLDVVSGSAGTILVALAARRILGDELALAVATAAAERLLATQTDVGAGYRAWPSVISTSSIPLAGFSHGASGYAVALSRVDELEPDPRYRAAIRHALNYERSLYDAAAGNWRDAREIAAGKGEFMTAWCHGAPGIGLARLELLGSRTDDMLREQLADDLEIAVRATLAAGLDGSAIDGLGNQSLCHGDFGNLEFLRRYAHTTGNRGMAIRTRRLLRTVVEVGRRRGWTCGVPTGVETPGLMTGLSGIGLGLLSAAHPQSVASPLLLEPPRAEASP